MKLTEESKDKVNQTTNLEEAKDIIAKAEKKLTDDEVGEATGGFNKLPNLEHSEPRKPDTPLPIIGPIREPDF